MVASMPCETGDGAAYREFHNLVPKKDLDAKGWILVWTRRHRMAVEGMQRDA